MAPNTVGSINSVSSKFTWKINFSAICNKNVGESVYSPRFKAMDVSNDVQWYMCLYPRGQTQASSDYLSIYLHLRAEIFEIDVSGSFKLIDNEGGVVTNRTLRKDAFLNSRSWGYKKLVSRDVVMNPENGILNAGIITIVCEISKSSYKEKEMTHRAKKRKPDEQGVNVLQQLEVITKYEALFNNAQFSDVSFISEGKTVKVHKCILANSSSVFAAMFDADMKEKRENIVRILDIKYDVLLEMIRFVYIGKVNKIDTFVDELAVAADKYALNELMDLCEKTMMENLSIDSVVDCLQLADRLCMDELKHEAIEFIVENARVVTDTPKFNLLSPSMLRTVCRGLAKSKHLVFPVV